MQSQYRKFGRLIVSTSLGVGLLGVSLAPIGAFASSSNDMMCDGASSPTQFAHKLDYGDDCGHSASELQNLYATVDKNVTAKNITNGNTTEGTVTSSGNVIVAGKVVATNAVSYGRTYFAGSHAVGTASDPLYGRPPAVSFATNSLPALVHIAKGKFRYAIIESCGNLITATPKIAAATPQASQTQPQATTPATPTPAATTVAPVINITQTQSQSQTQTQTPVVAPVQTAVATTTTPAATPATTPAAATTALPKTGATLDGLVGLTLICTAGWYWRRSQRRLALALRLPKSPR